MASPYRDGKVRKNKRDQEFDNVPISLINYQAMDTYITVPRTS